MPNAKEQLAQLALLQAMYKKLSEQVSTKDTNSIRSKMDKALIDAYNQTGVDRMRDTDLGVSLTVKFNDSKTQEFIAMENGGRFFEWLLTDEGKSNAAEFLIQHNKEFLDWCYKQGILPEGCSINIQHTAGGVAGTILKVDADKVLEKYATSLPEPIYGLLETNQE